MTSALAAARAGVAIEPEVAAAGVAGLEADWLIVEGAGGWRIPIDENRFLPAPCIGRVPHCSREPGAAVGDWRLPDIVAR